MSEGRLGTPVRGEGPSLLHGVRQVFARDLRVVLRRRADATAALMFFVIVVSLFPLGVGPEPQLLRSMAAGVVEANLRSSMPPRFSP